MILLIFVSILLISMKRIFSLRALHFVNNWLLWNSMWNVPKLETGIGFVPNKTGRQLC